MKTFMLFLSSLVFPLLAPTRAFAFKRLLLRFAGAKVAGSVRITSSVKVLISGELFIDEDVWIGHHCLIVGGDSIISIGKRCDIAPRVTIATGSHNIDVKGERVAGKGYSSPVEIGEGCWICTGSILLGGTKIGHHSIVAAGAVVQGYFPPYSLIGGTPARVLKDLRSEGYEQ